MKRRWVGFRVGGSCRMKGRSSVATRLTEKGERVWGRGNEEQNTCQGCLVSIQIIRIRYKRAEGGLFWSLSKKNRKKRIRRMRRGSLEWEISVLELWTEDKQKVWEKVLGKAVEEGRDRGVLGKK